MTEGEKSLKEMMQEDREQRQAEATVQINGILQQFDCVLDFIEVRRNGQFSGAQWKVTAN